MKRTSIFVILLSVPALLVVPASGHAAPDKNALTLSVTLDDIYNHHFQVILPITVNQPFKIVTTNGAVTNTISGTVGAPTQGKYSLPLYLSEYVSNDNNLTGTENYTLQLDKPASRGLTASFVYMRIVELTQSH